MTLNKHELDGVPKISASILPREKFEQLMVQAGYTQAVSAPARGNRVPAIYSPDMAIVITAYHP